MDIRRREAELFLLRYDGEETEAIGHLRYVNQKLDEAEEAVEVWEMNDTFMSDELDSMRSRLEQAEARATAAESMVATLKDAAKLGISSAALIKHREATK